MIQVTKSEAMLIRERCPWVHVARTKHKYYATEDFKAMQLLTHNSAARASLERQRKNRARRGGYSDGTY